MALWDWISGRPTQCVAIPATPATAERDRGELSQLSQLSQGVAFCKTSADNAATREVFEERAAIMEFEGGLSRADADRMAADACGMTRASAATTPGVGPVPWRGEGMDLGDLRLCLWCRNFTRTGRCLAAWRGELRAARDWGPTFPDLPQRCIGYKPAADDPDQRPGVERWPDMISWQGRRETIQ